MTTNNVHPLQLHARNAKEGLLKENEGHFLNEVPKVDKAMAVLGFVAEGMVVLILTFPAGLAIALGAAALPLFINVAAAWFHSTYYEIPDAYAAILERYEEHLLGETIPTSQALEICRYHAGIRYIATACRPKGIRSVEQAKGLAQATFAQERIADLEEQGTRAATQCEKACQVKIEALADRSPEPQVDIRGLTAEQAEQAKETWKANWKEAEVEKLQARLKSDLEGIQANYGQAIAYWRQKGEQGLQEYQAYAPDDASSDSIDT